MTFLSNEAIRCAKCMAKTITRSLANCPTAPLCCSGTALVAISSRQYPSSNLFSCLLKPLRGIVRRASCHVLGKVCRVPDHERDQQTQCTQYCEVREDLLNWNAKCCSRRPPEIPFDSQAEGVKEVFKADRRNGSCNLRVKVPGGQCVH